LVLVVYNAANTQIAQTATVTTQAFKKERYARLVAKTQNRYKWIAALHQQKKYKKKINGCVN